MSQARHFGARGDGQTDDTAALQHLIDAGDGHVEFPRGEYLITKPLVINLAKTGRTSISGSGGVAKIIHQGAGPALEFLGSHERTADPAHYRADEWLRERMPTVSSIEIEGANPEADGILLNGVSHPVISGVLIRKVRTAIRLKGRARNVLISHCHIYHNTGIGIHFDEVNLHQTIITGSHISYCRLGGIRIEGGEIRNLQITGNDIEYNNHRAFQVPGEEGLPTAEVYIDVRNGTVREGTISSNTIQATYSPNGANIRFIGSGVGKNHRAGMWTISGNLIGSQAVNLHLTSVRGLSISGNYIYSGHVRNVLVEGSQDIVFSGNCLGHNPDYGDKELCTGVQFVDCSGIVIQGMLLQDALAGEHTVAEAPPVKRAGLLELIRCQRINLTGSQILDGTPVGLFLEDCTDAIILGNTILETRQTPKMRAAIEIRGKSENLKIAECQLGKGT